MFPFPKLAALNTECHEPYPSAEKTLPSCMRMGEHVAQDRYPCHRRRESEGTEDRLRGKEATAS
jgi:hypothetical protein